MDYTQPDKDNLYKEHDKKKNCFKLTPYISQQDIENIKQFKYSGGDCGYMYRFFYDPVANWLVKHTPEWIAPNVITLAGGMFMLVPYLYMIIVYGTQFGYNAAPISRWFTLSVAFCYLFNRILDEMDGK